MTKPFRRTGKAVLLLLLSSTCVLVQCADSELDTLNQEVMDLYRTGDYDQAVALARKSVELAEKSAGPDHPDVATGLDYLGFLYDTQGQYAQSEPIYKRALAIRERPSVRIIPMWRQT